MKLLCVKTSCGKTQVCGAKLCPRNEMKYTWSIWFVVTCHKFHLCVRPLSYQEFICEVFLVYRVQLLNLHFIIYCLPLLFFEKNILLTSSAPFFLFVTYNLVWLAAWGRIARLMSLSKFWLSLHFFLSCWNVASSHQNHIIHGFSTQ